MQEYWSGLPFPSLHIHATTPTRTYCIAQRTKYFVATYEGKKSEKKNISPSFLSSCATDISEQSAGLVYIGFLGSTEIRDRETSRGISGLTSSVGA